MVCVTRICVSANRHDESSLFEMLNMLHTLSGSASGLKSLLSPLVPLNKLWSILGTSSPRIHRVICALAARCLPEMKPSSVKVAQRSGAQDFVTMIFLLIAKALALEIWGSAPDGTLHSEQLIMAPHIHPEMRLASQTASTAAGLTELLAKLSVRSSEWKEHIHTARRQL